MSLRHRLHEALVESGEKQLERVKSLPKMSELVMNIREEVRLNSSCWYFGSEVSVRCALMLRLFTFAALMTVYVNPLLCSWKYKLHPGTMGNQHIP